jgi:hypothetical protein
MLVVMTYHREREHDDARKPFRPAGVIVIDRRRVFR